MPAGDLLADAPRSDRPAGGSARTGARALAILATPLNALILKALAQRPMRLSDLRRATGLPAQTTLRGHLAALGELGIVTKHRTDELANGGGLESTLTPMGRELLDVADSLNRWLELAPEGRVPLESGSGKAIVKSLIDGWSSTIMLRMASRPMSLTELDRDIAQLSYPSLERRLSSMRMAGLIEARKGEGAGTPYAVTQWARRGVAPLVAAGKCEREHMGDGAAPVTRADIEAAFLLATPLVGLSRATTGTCQLEVEGVEARGQAGVSVTVERGKVVACESRLGPSPSDFAIGPPGRWFSAIKDGTASLLRFGGGRRVAEGIVVGLHAAMIIQ